MKGGEKAKKLFFTVTLPRSFLSVLLIGLCLNVAVTQCVCYAYFFFAQTIVERLRGIIFFIAHTIYGTVTAGDIFSLCTSRFFLFLFVWSKKGMLCTCRIFLIFYISLDKRGINKVVIFKRNTVSSSWSLVGIGPTCKNVIDALQLCVN